MELLQRHCQESKIITYAKGMGSQVGLLRYRDSPSVNFEFKESCQSSEQYSKYDM